MLDAAITTIPTPDDAPRVLAQLGVREGTTVDIPHMDSRTGSTFVRMEEDAAEFLGDWANWEDNTLEVALRIRYWDRLAFFGVMQAPEFDYDTGIVSVRAIDPTLRLGKAYVVAGDDLLDPGAALDGRGAWSIVNAGQNRENQDDLNWPSLGIARGRDLATVNRGAFRTLSIGDPLYPELQSFGNTEICPDWELEPFETSAANVATGSVTDAVGGVIAASATTNFILNVGLPGLVEGFRTGIWLTADKPGALKIHLIAPGGEVIELYDGTRDRNQSVTGGDAFGTGTADAQLAFFRDQGKYPYGTTLNPSTFPKVGALLSEDPPMAVLTDYDPTGNWTLRVINSHPVAATLHRWTLRYLPAPHAYVRLNTYDKPDTDNPVIDAIFHKGFGKANTGSFVVKPLGEQVTNQYIAVSKAGHRIIRQNATSRSEKGTYQGWRNTTEDDSDDLLAAIADAQVKAFGRPPPLTEPFQPTIDYGQDNLPRLLFEYRVGSHVKGVAKRGHCRHRIVSRVKGATLTQERSGTRTELRTLPTVSTNAELGDG